jgi:hypothetical protein
VAGDFRIISAAAEAFDGKPEDQLATVAPAILKTQFKYQDPDIRTFVNGKLITRSWGNSPEAMIDFFRRYRPDNKFTYTAEEDPS